MTRAATTLADPCTGAPRRDFLLGLRHGQLVGAHVPSWCSRHGVDAGCSQRVGPPGQLTSRSYQTPAEGTGVDAPRRHRCARVVVLNDHSRRRPWGRLARSDWTWRSSVFQAHGADASGACGVPQAAAAERGSLVLRRPAALHGGDGGLRRRASLGARDRQAGPRGAADPAGLRQAVRQAAEERHARMPRRSARPRSARPCALWPSKARDQQAALSCSARAICWCGSGPSHQCPARAPGRVRHGGAPKDRLMSPSCRRLSRTRTSLCRRCARQSSQS